MKPPSTTKWFAVTDARIPPEFAGLPVLTADDFVEGEPGEMPGGDGGTVVNLCKSCQYLTKGYYVSLIAEARHHPVFPTLEMAEELGNPYTYFRVLGEAGIDMIDYRVLPGRKRALPSMLVINKEDQAGRERGIALVKNAGNNFSYHTAPTLLTYVEVNGVMGRSSDPRFAKEVETIFRVYRFPILRIRFYQDGLETRVGQVYPGSLKDLSPEELALLAGELRSESFLAPERQAEVSRTERIACLWDASDPFVPSARDTLDRMAEVAERRGVQFELITKDDLNRLAEYDALFIRTMTNLSRYSFVFAQTAETMGLPVIDDPQSIIRCSNKVYLHEVFSRNGVPTPKTMIVTRNTSAAEVNAFGLPMILKVPDGTFSTAVKKVATMAEFDAMSREMFKASPLLIGQEFLPTDFDWRVGILKGEVLFTARYFMAPGHWQIAATDAAGKQSYGRVQAVKMEQAPGEVKRVAVACAKLIGDGLYGVDVKELPDGRALAIEINDNPNIDYEVEDVAEGDTIYERIIDHFIARIHESAVAAK